MSNPSYDIASIIAANALGTLGTDLFVDRIPEDISVLCTGILNSGGPAPNPAYTRDDYDIQIIVRGEEFGISAAWTQIEAIKNLLLGMDPQTVGTDIYARFIARTNIAFLGYDTLNRPKYSFNMRITIDGPDTGNRLEIA